MKKIIAGFSALALVLGFVVTPVNAAAVDFTASATTAGVDTLMGTADDVVGPITLSVPAAFSAATTDADYVDFHITNTADGSDVTLTTGLAVDIQSAGTVSVVETLAEGKFRASVDTVAGLVAGGNIVVTLGAIGDFTNGNAYTIAFNSSNGDFGAAMFNVGTANQVNVSAEVEPILVMALANTSIKFGTLTVDTEKQATAAVDAESARFNLAVINNDPAAGEQFFATPTNGTTVSTDVADIAQNTNSYLNVSTNAANGYIVNVSNLGLKDPASGSAATNPTATITVEGTAIAGGEDPASAAITVDGDVLALDIVANATNNDIATALAGVINAGVNSAVANANVITITNATAGVAKNGVAIDTTAISDAMNLVDLSDDDTVLSATIFSGGQDYAAANEIAAVSSTAGAANGSHNTEDLTNAAGYGYGINAYTLYDGETFDLVTSKTATVQPTGVDYTGTTAAAVGALQSSSQPLAFSQGPVSNQVTAVKFWAKVSPLQPAGNYTDTVTFTVTGNF